MGPVQHSVSNSLNQIDNRARPRRLNLVARDSIPQGKLRLHLIPAAILQRGASKELWMPACKDKAIWDATSKPPCQLPFD
jgi:hypothetical protein